jgi:phage baseplate assembly protein V
MRPDRIRGGLVIGKVTAVADQEKQGRVQVQFPWLDDQLQSTWASVVAPFAGNDRGLYWMPEVGDEVVVGFIHGDFSQAFILGATWNGTAAAPSPDPRQRMIRSKNGHTIRFVDSTPNAGNQGALIIEDAHGNRVIMTNSVMRITAQSTLMIEADTIVLTGRPVNGAAPWSRTVTPSNNPI